ncbi:MAG: SprB repeat-containing protein [Saprospiraceae bacterium]|nr:SprB repeat-containing protein [Saprospiraceae bacterium]
MIFKNATYLFVFTLFLFGAIAQDAFGQIVPLELSVTSGMGEQGTQVCLDVTAKNFDNIESIQFNLSYNATLVTPVCPASYVHPQLSTSVFGEIFSCISKDNGFINFVWADDPKTIPDGEIIFTLCFDLIGNPGNSSPVYFNGLQLLVEVCKQDAMGKTVCTDDLISNVGTIMIKSNSLVGFANKCDADGINNIENAFITFYATGGTPPYTYNINSGAYTGSILMDGQRITISNIPQTNYNIVLTDANGFMYAIPTITVSNSEPLIYDVPLVKNETCFDRKNGSINIPNVNGGISPYTFEWSNYISGKNVNSISNLSTGSYFVTITDATGCIVKDTFKLVLDTLRLDVVFTKLASCKEMKNGIITINVTGGSSWKLGQPYEYSLNSNNWIRFTPPISIAGIGLGNFNLNVKDSLFCDTDNKTYVMPVEKVLNLAVSKTDESCGGRKDGMATLTCSPYSDKYTYRFLPLFPNLGVSPKTDTFKIIDISPGNYGYSVIDEDGCKDSVYFSIITASKILLDSVITQPDCATAGSIF